MSSASTNSSIPQALPFEVPARPVPSLDELYAMTSEPDERVVIRDVDWAFYEQLVDSIAEGINLHVDYDGKDLEIMAPSVLHDGDKKLFGQFVEAVAQELEIPYRSAGSTTWKRPDVARGLEADECYFFEAAKLAAIAGARASRSKEVADYPNPDLGIEVDISPSKIDRPGIYAALRVSEVWRFDGARQDVIIERLAEDGSYHPSGAVRSCRSGPRRSGGGSSKKTRVMGLRGPADCVPGSGPNWLLGSRDDPREGFRPGPKSWSHSMIAPITITITAIEGKPFRAETPGGPIEAGSLRERGDRSRDLLANLEDVNASDLADLVRLSRSATDQATLLELARISPPPTSGSKTTDGGRRSGGRRAMSAGFFYVQIVRIRVARHGKEKIRPVVVVTPKEEMTDGASLVGVAITGTPDPPTGFEVPWP